MKTLFAGAVSALALLAAAEASETVKFDLYRSTDAAQSLVAIAQNGDAAPFAVAGGADKMALDILADDAATTAIAELKAKTDEAALPQLADADIEAIEDGKKAKSKKKAKKGDEVVEAHEHNKVILVKQVEGEGKEVKIERRIIKLDETGAPAADAAAPAADATATTDATAAAAPAPAGEEILIADHEELAKYAKADHGKIIVIEKTDNGAPTRVVKISGVGVDAARSFIDDAHGLDAAEKAAMKTKLGL